MKKIFSLLAVFALVVSLAVPSFAATTTYFISGVWEFNSELSASPYTDYTSIEVNFTSRGNEYTSMNFQGSKYLLYGGSTAYSFSNNSWNWPDYNTVDFGSSSQEVPAEFFTWLSQNATQLSGESAPGESTPEAPTTVELTGKYVLKDTSPWPSLYISEDIYFLFGGDHFVSLTIDGNARTITFKDLLNNDVVVADSDGWLTSTRDLIFGDEPLTVSSNFYYWLTQNATYVSCDGSTCPAFDLNHDDICDDCGSVFVYSLRDDTFYNYNGVYLPKLPNVNTELYPYYYIIYLEDTDYALLRFSTTPLSYQSSNNSLIYSGDGVGLQYQFKDEVWTYVSEFNISSNQTASQPYTSVLWTNFDVVNDEGSVLIKGDSNFMPPLWSTILGVTQGEMTQTQGKVAGAMKILALCGVGCLTLLVVLKLFGKRSLISLR